MNKLKKLKTLNVSYTYVKLEHLTLLNRMCPNLKNVCANYEFQEKKNVQESFSRVQNFLKNLENVHFILSLSDLYCVSLFTIFQGANLNSLKFTVSRSDFTTFVIERNTCDLPQFKQFYINLLNWQNTAISFPQLKDIPLIAMLDLSQFEFIILYSSKLNNHTIFVSKLFVKFFNENFDVQPYCVANLDDIHSVSGNAALMLWKKDCTNFDKKFFQNLYRRIKPFFPYSVNENESTLPCKYDWFLVAPMPQITNNKNYEPKKKKRRIGVRKTILDYDTLFENKQKIQLSFDFINLNKEAVTLIPNSNYLSKITYLSLIGSVRYSSEFFNVLFRSCTELTTLNVEAPVISPCCLSICRSLPLSSSLRNLRLVDKGIDFNTLFSAISQCRNIENIFIKEDSDVFTLKHVDPSIIFQNCPNLYNFYFDLPMTESCKSHWRPLFSKAIVLYKKDHVNVILFPRLERPSKNKFYYYDPFMEIFQLNPIKDV